MKSVSVSIFLLLGTFYISAEPNQIKRIIHNPLKQPSQTSNKYCISGGPCVGKTSLINYLAQKGFQTAPEAYACIFEESREQGTLASFFADPVKLRERLIYKQLELESNCNPYQHAFLDRSMVDIIFYADYFHTLLPPALIEKANQTSYNSYVFFLEPLPEHLYVMNDRRGEDRVEALKMHEALKQSYLRSGYQIINIPFDSLEVRAQKILFFLAKTSIIVDKSF